MPENFFGEQVAARFDERYAHLAGPAVVDPMVDFLVERLGGGAALELGIGTGRIAVPLARRGIRVHGIELSPAMVAELHARQGGSGIEVTIGDLARTRAAGTFSLVYLVRNTITNLTTQDEQVEAFRNAARHLAPGGCFVIENYVPNIQRLPPGETVHLVAATPAHVGFEEYDLTAQIAYSHHYWMIEGQIRTLS